MRKKTFYTTSEYIDALVLQNDGNLYSCVGKDFQFFSNAGAADYDAQWLVNYYSKEGKRRPKPVIYRVRLERVPPKNMREKKK